MKRGLFVSILIIGLVLVIASPAFAQIQANNGLNEVGNTIGYNTETTLAQTIGNIIRIVLGLLGLIALIIMIIAGFKWMTAGGNVEQVEAAKKLLKNGLIGLLIIVLSYAIVSFIISKLSGVTGPEPGPGPGPGPGPFPEDVFKVKEIETTHEGQDHQNQVYLCSAVQPIFNRVLDSSAIEDLEGDQLRIESDTKTIEGDWSTRGNVSVFKHPELFEKNTNYSTYLPKSILDTNGNTLKQCLASGDCAETANNFIWNFETGEKLDDISPKIVSTYPISDKTAQTYPDQNVSTQPNLKVEFSEGIDVTTVINENNKPNSNNIWVGKLDGKDGEVEKTISNDNWNIEMTDKGFYLSPINGEVFKPFTWYEIHVKDIEDLCMNEMQGEKSWKFQVNDNAPGISSWNPTGDKVCPDTNISIAFNSTMEQQRVQMSITGEEISYTFDLDPLEIGEPYVKNIIRDDNKIGEFKILDPGPNGFRVFSFDPENDLKENVEYNVKVVSDLVVDRQGSLLSKSWSFTTTTLKTCECSPWISYIDPNRGGPGECITLHGSCFAGTDYKPAEPTDLNFILNENQTEGNVQGYNKNYITTVVPENFSKEDNIDINTAITYIDSGTEIISNKASFYVNTDNKANGPCLFGANPDKGYPQKTKVDLQGTRLGEETDSSQVTFYNEKQASYENWTDTSIDNALVPQGAETGKLTVSNKVGTSNGLPFSISDHPLPRIDSITPNQGTNNPDIPTYVTISGDNFGFSQGQKIVQFDDVTAEIGCNNWSDEKIIAIVPESLEMGETYSVKVVDSGWGASNEKDFTVNNTFHPAICELSPNNGKTGAEFNIQGMNFGDNQESSYVVFDYGSMNSKDLTEFSKKAWSNTTISAKAPETPDSVSDIVVYVPSPIEQDNPLKASNPVPFYKPPIIESITPDSGRERTWVTIRGENFLSTNGIVNFTKGDQVYQGANLPEFCGDTWSNEQIIISAPHNLPFPEDSNSYKAQVSIKTSANVESNNLDWTVTKEPLGAALCSIEPGKQLPGYSPINIKGERFSLSEELDFERELVFNPDAKVTELDWTSDEEIKDITVPDKTKTGNVKVNKKTTGNCRMVCSGFEFAGTCIGGERIEVCDQVWVESNPLLFEVGLPLKPSKGLEVKNIETTHEGEEESYNTDVYLCSKVQPLFNNDLNKQTITNLSDAGELKVEQDNTNVSGSWQVSGNSLQFNHPTNFDSNSAYTLFLPKSIDDVNGNLLQSCQAAGDCSELENEFRWNFETGDKLDQEPPSIVSTIPTSDFGSEDYPNRNVSTKPSIRVNFSEGIDVSSVLDEDGNIDDSVTISRINNQGGSVLATLSKEKWDLQAMDNGFMLNLKDENVLEPFVWYRVSIGGVEDLCGNAMESSFDWEFQTNDSAPGISGWYPQGDNVCPDADIGVIFNTSMYSNTVTMTLNGGGNLYSFEITPFNIGNPEMGNFSKEITNDSGEKIGEFVIKDTDNVNDFRVFIFEPVSGVLQNNTDYNIKVDTDLVTNTEGNFLSKTWDFHVTNLEDCICKPFLYSLDPDQGGPGECVTLYGNCFTGTTSKAAEPEELLFDGTKGNIENYDSNFIVTTLPDNFEVDNRPLVSTSIKYQDSGQVVDSVNKLEFFVNTEEQANGPCLLNLYPKQGYNGETRVNFSGIRFNAETESSQALFYNNQSANYSNWTDTKVNQAVVPEQAETGKAYILNNIGQSNGLPFTVLDISDKDETTLMVVRDEICIDTNQSPTPWPDKKEICRNAGIGARFNKSVSGLNANNIIVEKCNASEQDFNSENCSPIKGNLDVKDKKFVFKPNNLLNSNSWYRVTLKSGENGIISENSQLLDGNKNGLEDGAPLDDYTWQFATGDKVCPPEKINLNEDLSEDEIEGVILYEEDGENTKEYIASSIGPGCQILVNDISWFWQSGNTDVATIQKNNNFNYLATATGKDLGTTDIIVKAGLSEENAISTSKELAVATQPKVESTKPVNGETGVCRNVAPYALFDQKINNNTLKDNVVLVKNPDTPDKPTGLNLFDISSDIIKLNWQDNSLNEEEFIVEKKSTSTASKLKDFRIASSWQQEAVLPANTSYFSDKDVVEGENYIYRVYSRSEDFGSSEKSNSLEVTIETCQAPDIQVETCEDCGDVEHALNYRRERVCLKSGFWDAWSNWKAIECEQYYEASDDGRCLPAKPTSPSNFKISEVTNETIKLEWSDVERESSYELRRSLSSAGCMSEEGWISWSSCDRHALIKGDETSFDDEDIKENTFYYYKIRSCNEIGCSDWSEVAEAISSPSIPKNIFIREPIIREDNSIDLSVHWGSSPNAQFYKIKYTIRNDGSGIINTDETEEPSLSEYLHEEVQPSSDYVYQIQACSSGGSCSNYSDAAVVSTPVLPPDAPIGLSLDEDETTDTKTKLTWSNVEGETEYRVYQSQNENGCSNLWDNCSWTQKTNSDVTNYIAESLTPETEYFYKIKACNEDGCSNFSDFASIITAPNPPSSLQASTQTGEEIYLSWKDESNTEDGFIVERKEIDQNWSNSETLEVDAVDANNDSYIQYEDQSGIIKGNTYQYRILVYRGNARSSYSSQISIKATTQPPFIPNDFKIESVTSSRIDLSWQDTPNEGNYRLYRSENSDGCETAGAYNYGDAELSWDNCSILKNISQDVSIYSDANVTSSTEYYYKIKSCNEVGCSDFSDPLAITTNAISAPGIPTNLAASAESYNNVRISWSDVSIEKAYRIKRAPRQDGCYNIQAKEYDWGYCDNVVVAQKNQTSSLDESAKASTDYYYRISACNSVGCSDLSGVDSATTPFGSPEVKVKSVNTTSVTLGWNDVNGEDKYIVYRAESKDGCSGSFSNCPSSQISANDTSFTGNSLDKQTTYYYVVSACSNNYINGSSGCSKSEPIPATTLSENLSAPTNISGSTKSETAINLNWSKIVGCNYKVYQTTVSNGCIAEGGTSWENCNSYKLVKESQTVIGNLEPDTTYHFKIKACTDYSCSDFSDKISVPTSSPPSNLEANITGSQEVTLNWDGTGVLNESSFLLERRPTQAPEDLGWPWDKEVGANTTSYVDSGLYPNMSYSYRIRAKYEGYYSNNYSNVTESGILGDLALIAPSNVSTKPLGDTKVSISWDDNSGNETGFKIERDGNFVQEDSSDLILPSNTTSFTDTNLKPKTDYNYRVGAYKVEAYGNTIVQFSNTKIGSTYYCTPNTFSTDTCYVTNQEVFEEVNQKNAQGKGTITRECDANGQWVGDNICKDIKCYDGYTLYNDPNLEENECLIEPNIPSNFSATTQHYSLILLSWTDNSDNEQKFIIQRDGNELAVLESDVISYYDDGVNPDTAYSYRIKACNRLGCSDWSPTFTARTPKKPIGIPDAPSDLGASNPSSTSVVDLSWTDNSSDVGTYYGSYTYSYYGYYGEYGEFDVQEDGFKIERKTDVSSWTQIDTVPPDTTTYKDKNLLSGAIYHYRVRAYTTGYQAGDSAYSNEDSAATLLCQPTTNTGEDNTKTISCDVEHGRGEKVLTCNDDGSKWLYPNPNECALIECYESYVRKTDGDPYGEYGESDANNEYCVRMQCTPGVRISEACSISHGIGERYKDCSENGLWLEWSDCTLLECDYGYKRDGNTCAAMACSPMETETRSCSIDDGTGQKQCICTSGGESWSCGDCELISCDFGYKQSNDGNSCVAVSCIPDNTTGRECTDGNGNTGYQFATCQDDGTWGDWTSCNINVDPDSCSDGDTDSQNCTDEYGESGTQTRTCESGEWDAWGDCVVSNDPNGPTGTVSCSLSGDEARLTNITPSGSQDYGNYSVNQSVWGRDLVVGGIKYEKGIGTHANSSWTYNLNNNYDTFTTSFGLDDEEDCGNTAGFQIKVDGELRKGPTSKSVGQSASFVSVDVSGADQLTLETLADDGAINCDHTNWACPILTSSGSAVKEKSNFFIAAQQEEPEKNVPVQMTVKTFVNENGNSQVQFVPKGALEPNTKYQVLIQGGKEGIKSEFGVPMKKSKSWTFETGNEICSLDNIDLNAQEPDIPEGNFNISSPNMISVFEKNTEVNFVAIPKSGNTIISPVEDKYTWDWSWGLSDTNIAQITGSNTNIETALIGNKNGTTNIAAQANITVDSINTPSTVGNTITGEGKINVAVCENPWFYNDPITNYKFFYCRDAETVLPELIKPEE